jgi:hypothetical protein
MPSLLIIMWLLFRRLSPSGTYFVGLQDVINKKKRKRKKRLYPG